MSGRRLSNIFVFGACALAGVGCGGGSTSDTPAPRSMSTSPTPSNGKAGYVKQANAICRAAAAKSPAFPGAKAGTGFVTTASEVIPYLEKTSKISARTLHLLERLETPAGKKAEVSDLIAAQRARLNDQTLALNAANQANTRDFTAAFQKDQRIDGAAYTHAAAKLGLDACTG
jgi:hypothetical protein